MDLRRALGVRGRAVVAFVGAGGKKTAMSQLVREAGDRSVAYTTTTNMPPPPDLPLVLLTPEQLDSMDRTESGAIALARGSIDAPERVSTKLRGFDSETIDRLSRREIFDWILVKADGARQRELTAPAAHEPAIPASSTVVVVVVSVDAIGHPVDSAAIHRPEQVAAVAGIDRSDTVSVEAVAALLTADDGGLKGVPPDSRAVLLVNKADTEEQRETARSLIDAVVVRTDRFDSGIVSSFDRNYLDVVAGD